MPNIEKEIIQKQTPFF